MDVGRDAVIHALRCGGVTVVVGEGEKVTLIKDDVVESQFFPEIVPRRLVVRLSNKFDVPAEFFWHPERIPEKHRQSGYAEH